MKIYREKFKHSAQIPWKRVFHGIPFCKGLGTETGQETFYLDRVIIIELNFSDYSRVLICKHSS